MNPFFFGSSKSPLYGVYHPPKSGAGPAKAVLLCYPLEAEYMRAHRAFRQLTALLVRGGVHVLRFDYFGTGDSAGDGAEVTLARCIDDVGTAIEELKVSAQVDTVSVIGLRFGATIAALAVQERSDVEHLLLWDPVIDGKLYVSAMLAAHRVEQAGRRRASGAVHPGVNGFPLSAALQSEIGAVDLRNWEGPSTPRLDLVTSAEGAEYDELVRAVHGRGGHIRHSVSVSNGNWSESDAFGSALIPQDIIKEVLARALTATSEVA